MALLILLWNSDPDLRASLLLNASARPLPGSPGDTVRVRVRFTPDIGETSEEEEQRVIARREKSAGRAVQPSAPRVGVATPGWSG